MKNLIFFDTESTGLVDPYLVQLAWKEEGAEIQEQYFKPPVPISFGAMATHHITEEDVADKPTFDDEAKIYWNAKFKDAVAVAHNLEYDVQVMRNAGVTLPQGICTLKVARKLFPDQEMHKLQYLRYSLGLKISKENVAHDAIGDVEVLYQLFRVLWNTVAERKLAEDADDAVQWMINTTAQPSLITRFTFGKHNGKLVQDVLKEAPDYLQWLLKQPTLDKDLRYSLNYFIKNK